MFDRALKLDPHSPQALFYTAVSALNNGNLELARSRFAELRDLGPPPNVVAALDKQIGAIDAEMARQKPDPATSYPSAGHAGTGRGSEHTEAGHFVRVRAIPPGRTAAGRQAPQSGNSLSVWISRRMIR